MKVRMSRSEFEARFNGQKKKASVDDFWIAYHHPDQSWKKELKRRMDWMVQRACGPKVLDVGCGSGIGTYLLAQRPETSEVIGLDIADDAISIALGNLSGVDASILGKVHLFQGWAESLPWDSGYFDGILLGEVLEHVYDDVQVLDEVFRVIRPGGNLLVSVPIRGGLDDDHLRMFTSNSILDLLKSRFRVEESIVIRHWFTCHCRKERR